MLTARYEQLGVRDGDAVHARFLADPRFERLRGMRTERYRIDVLRVNLVN